VFRRISDTGRDIGRSSRSYQFGTIAAVMQDWVYSRYLELLDTKLLAQTIMIYNLHVSSKKFFSAPVACLRMSVWVVRCELWVVRWCELWVVRWCELWVVRWGEVSCELWGDVSCELWGDVSCEMWGDVSCELWGVRWECEIGVFQ
jgi:hypothetical protein